MEARGLISGFLDHDLSKRLGCQNDGADNIKKNAWF